MDDRRSGKDEWELAASKRSKSEADIQNDDRNKESSTEIASSSQSNDSSSACFDAKIVQYLIMFCLPLLYFHCYTFIFIQRYASLLANGLLLLSTFFRTKPVLI